MLDAPVGIFIEHLCQALAGPPKLLRHMRARFAGRVLVLLFNKEMLRWLNPPKCSILLWGMVLDGD